MKSLFSLFIFIQLAVTTIAQQTEPPYKRFPTLPPLKLLLTDHIERYTIPASMILMINRCIGIIRNKTFPGFFLTDTLAIF